MDLNSNVEFSKNWLTEELIKTDFEERKTHQVKMIAMSKKDLFRLIIKFVKLNEKGEL